MKQRAWLRVGGPQRIFGSEESREDYWREWEEAHDRQTVRYAVAPRESVVLADGRVLGPGAEVKLADLEGADVAAPLRLQRLIFHCIVIERDNIAAEAPQKAHENA